MAGGSNAQKIPLARSLNEIAVGRATSAIHLLGKALPASVVSVNNSIVTVKFEVQTTFTLPQVTVPVATSQWRREPIQVGDLGVVRPADAPLGAISGLGAATAPLVTLANLEALVWEPVASNKWDPTDDADAYVIYGPNGAVIRTQDKKATVTVSKNSIVMEFNGKTVTLDDDGLSIECDVTITGQLSSSDTTGLAGGSKKVALDGDSVVAGKVVASSTKTKAT